MDPQTKITITLIITGTIISIPVVIMIALEVIRKLFRDNQEREPFSINYKIKKS